MASRTERSEFAKEASSARRTPSPNAMLPVMHKYGIAAHCKRKKYVYPGKAAQIASNKLREGTDLPETEVVFSDVLEVKLAAGARISSTLAAGGGTAQASRALWASGATARGSWHSCCHSIRTRERCTPINLGPNRRVEL
jgi:hypothetical protein